MKREHFASLLVIATSQLAGCKAEQNKEGSKLPARQNQTETFWITGPAGRLFVDRGGAGGTPVVFVHSLAGNTTQWRSQFGHLRQHRLAIAYDMRGHGLSDPARDGDYSLEAMSNDLAAVADSLGLEKFILIGHSYGGGVIAVYAGAHLERVAGLLFVDPTGDARHMPKAQIEPFMQTLRSDSYTEAIEAYWRSILMNADSSVVEAVIASLRKTPKAAVIGATEAILEFDPVSTLASYHGPMQTIVSGLPDNPSALHHAIPNLPKLTLPGTSHWLQMDQPEKFNKNMDVFLNCIE